MASSDSESSENEDEDEDDDANGKDDLENFIASTSL